MRGLRKQRAGCIEMQRNGRRGEYAHFAIIRVSSAAFFLINSALAVVRFLILSSWVPHSFASSVFWAWRSFMDEARFSTMWAS